MELRQQALSAVAATALLAGVSGALILSGGMRSSLAETINAEALAALTAATSQPGPELKAQLDAMDKTTPGLSQQFVAAIQGAKDTDGLAASLQALAAQQQGLQSTIDSALTALAKDPQVSSMAAASVPPAALVSAVQTSFSVGLSGPPASGTPTTNASNTAPPDNAGLGNLVPAAAPNPAAPANSPVLTSSLPRSIAYSPASTPAVGTGTGAPVSPTTPVSFTPSVVPIGNNGAGGGPIIPVTVTPPGGGGRPNSRP